MRGSLIGGLACVAILAAGLVLAACGSSNDNSPSTTGISKAEFIRKASAICLKGNARIGRAIHDVQKRQARLAHTRGESIGPPTSVEIAKLGRDIAIPTIQRELDQIRALGAAPGAEHKIKALIDEEQSAVDKVRVAPTLFGSQSKTAPFRTSKVAKDYGLSFCGFGA